MVRKNNIYLYRGQLVRVTMGGEHVVHLQTITVNSTTVKDSRGKEIVIPVVNFGIGRVNDVPVQALRSANKESISLWVSWLRMTRQATREQHMRKIGSVRSYAQIHREDIVDVSKYTNIE